MKWSNFWLEQIKVVFMTLEENEWQLFFNDHHSQALSFHLSVCLGDSLQSNFLERRRETWGGSICPVQKI